MKIYKPAFAQFLSLKTIQKAWFRDSLHLCIIFLILKGDVENSVNKKDYHGSTLRNLLYISQFILGQLDHVPIILISLHSYSVNNYIRMVDRIWMHSYISYFFWNDEFDIVCHEVSPSVKGITIKYWLTRDHCGMVGT